MSLAGYHIRPSHLKLIATSHVKNSLRSGSGVIFLVLTMIFGIMLAGGIAVAPFEAMQKTKGAGRAFDELLHRFGPDVLQFVTNVDDQQAQFLLFDKPVLITLFLIFLMVMIPSLAALAGFNQTSGDIGSKGLRYLLLRTERANVFLGRLIGTYIFALAVITVIMLVVGLYVLIKVDTHPAGDVLPWLARGWLASAVFVLPWIALNAWISSTLGTPFLALLITMAGSGFWFIFVAIMTSKASEVGYAAYITPWGFKWWLLHSNLGVFFGGIAIMLGFTALFTFMGLRHFHKRDV